MSQKVILFNSKKNVESRDRELQIDSLEKIKLWISKQQKFLKKEDINEKILFTSFSRFMDMAIKEKFFSDDELKKYLETVSFLLKKETSNLESGLDIEFYTCMVAVAKEKVLKLNENIIDILINSFAEVEISVSLLPKYLNVLLKKEIINLLEQNQDKVPIIQILSNIISMIEPFNFNSVFSQLEDEIHNSLERSSNPFIGTLLGGEQDFNSIYTILKEQMENLSEYGIFYSKEQFQLLEKLKKFYYFPLELQEIFLLALRNLDSKVPGLLDKIEKILMLIDNFYFEFQKREQVIKVNFTGRRSKK